MKMNWLYTIFTVYLLLVVQSAYSTLATDLCHDDEIAVSLNRSSRLFCFQRQNQSWPLQETNKQMPYDSKPVYGDILSNILKFLSNTLNLFYDCYSYCTELLRFDQLSTHSASFKSPLNYYNQVNNNRANKHSNNSSSNANYSSWPVYQQSLQQIKCMKLSYKNTIQELMVKRKKALDGAYLYLVEKYSRIRPLLLEATSNEHNIHYIDDIKQRPKLNIQVDQTCPIWQQSLNRNLDRLKYIYYSIKFQVQFIYIRATSCIEELYLLHYTNKALTRDTQFTVLQPQQENTEASTKRMTSKDFILNSSLSNQKNLAYTLYQHIKNQSRLLFHALFRSKTESSSSQLQIEQPYDISAIDVKVLDFTREQLSPWETRIAANTIEYYKAPFKEALINMESFEEELPQELLKFVAMPLPSWNETDIIIQNEDYGYYPRIIRNTINRLSGTLRQSAIEIRNKWVFNNHLHGRYMFSILQGHALERNEILSSWMSQYIKYSDDGCRGTDLHDPKMKLRTLIIQQEWKITKHRLSKLFLEQYKEILGVEFEYIYYEDCGLLCEYFNEISSISQYTSKQLIIKHLNQTQTMLESQLQKSAIELIQHQKRDVKYFYTKANNSYRESLATQIEFFWSGIPKATLPNDYVKDIGWRKYLLNYTTSLWSNLKEQVLLRLTIGRIRPLPGPPDMDWFM